MRATMGGPDRVSNAARPGAGQLSLADALDRILHRGVSLQGNLTIGLADVDLLFLDLRLLLGSVDAIWPDGPPPVLPVRPARFLSRRLRSRCLSLRRLRHSTPNALPRSEARRRSKLRLLPNHSPAVCGPPVDAGRAPSEPGSSTAQGLVRLVLTLVKLLHDVLERQAVRRMEAGRLTDATNRELGAALSRKPRRF